MLREITLRLKVSREVIYLKVKMRSEQYFRPHSKMKGFMTAEEMIFSHSNLF